jgi:hypothetical protein
MQNFEERGLFMELKWLSIKKRLSIILPTFFVTIVLLLCAWIFFVNKEVSYLTERCYSAGGSPKFELFIFNYSFSCN